MANLGHLVFVESVLEGYYEEVNTSYEWYGGNEETERQKLLEIENALRIIRELIAERENEKT